MRVESVALLLGIIVLLVAAAIIADAVVADDSTFLGERRSRARPERSKAGQIIFGAGVICVAAVFIGGDEWRFSTLAIAVAVVLVVIGVGLNVRYIRGSVLGPVLGRSAKRRESDRQPPAEKKRP